jgi:hypothetical protein
MRARHFTLSVAAFAVSALITASLLRWLLPSTSGITLHLRRSARYLPANTVAFWLILAGALLVLLLLVLGRTLRRR